MTLGYLQRLGLEELAYKKNHVLTCEERFYVMLLRAAMVTDAVIIVDRPFKIVPDITDTIFICRALKTIDDLFTKCYILDYISHRDRYSWIRDDQ
ncbi:MAG: hypothetical protein WC560_04850 [Syntrophales bacterium]